MAGTIKVYLPQRISEVNQKVWLHNVDKNALFINWGDGSGIQVTGDTNNEFISHTYTTVGDYNIYVSYTNVWGDDQGNAIVTTTLSGIFIESDDNLITDAISVQNFPTYSENVTNNAFLSLSLPHSAVEIGSNEFAVADNINAVLTRLHENTSYLLEQTTIIDPTLRNTFLGWLSGGPGSTNLWNPNLPNLDDNFNTPTLTSGFVNIADIQIKDFNNTRYIYLIENNKLKLLNGVSLYANTIISVSSVGFNGAFNNLSALDVDSSGNIFLLDSGTIYKTQFDTINTRIVLETQIGGTGTQEDRYLFNQASDIAIDNQDRVYVVDTNNLCVKVYTKNLIWANTITADGFSGGNKPIKICTNPVNGEIYVITTGRDLFVFDANLNFVSQVSLITTANSVGLISTIYNESIRKIFSDRQSNYLHVITDNAAIKFTKTGRLINKIVNPTAPAFTNLRSGCIDSSNQLFVAGTDRIFQLLDLAQSTSLKANTETPISLSAITLNTNGHEFVQDWVYNKALKKVLRNLIVLNGSLNQKVVVSFDLDGSLRSFFIRPLDANEKVTINIDLNNFVNVNEFVLSSVINRALKSILDNQKNILTVIKPSVIFIPSAIPYPVLP